MSAWTPTQIFAAILGVCAGISTIGAAVGCLTGIVTERVFKALRLNTENGGR